MSEMEVSYFDKPLACEGERTGRLISLDGAVEILGIRFLRCELLVEEEGQWKRKTRLVEARRLRRSAG